MPRFVILEHDHPFLHWDLMLETGDALQTWRLLQVPGVEIPGISEDSGDLKPTVIAAEKLPDHRLAYLDYEGPVSGNRGNVTRWDAGEYQFVERSAERWVVDLNGTAVTGRAVLQRLETTTDANAEQWEFRWDRGKRSPAAE